MRTTFILFCISILVGCSRQSVPTVQSLKSDSTHVTSVNGDSSFKAQANVLEQLLGKSGTLSIVDGMKIGVEVFGKKSTSYGFTDHYDAVTVECVVLKLSEDDSLRARGLRIGVGTLVTQDKQKTSPSYSIPKAFVNYTEIPKLLENIDNIASLYTKWQGTQRENTVVVYKTSDKLEVHLDHKGTEQSIYFRIERIKPSYADLHTLDDLMKVKSLIQLGYDRLKNL